MGNYLVKYQGEIWRIAQPPSIGNWDGTYILISTRGFSFVVASSKDVVVIDKEEFPEEYV